MSQPKRQIGERSRSRRTGFVAAMVILVLAFASGAQAQGDREGWTPAVRFGFGVHVQGLDGNILSPDSPTPIQFRPTNGISTDVSSPKSPGDSAVTEVFRFGLRVYAPEDLLPERAYIPRLFVQAGFEKPLDDGFIAARYDASFDQNQADVNKPSIAQACPNAMAANVSACAYEGRASLDILWNWDVSVGADFKLPIADGQFHLVPVLGYFGQAFESEAEFTVTVSERVGTGVVDAIRVISGKGDTEILHGIMTGLGLEIDVYEGESVEARIFLEGRAAWLLNDRTSNFVGANPTPSPQFSTGDFLLRPSGFVSLVGAGVELRWTGR